MKAKNFDFSRFEDWAAAQDAVARDFLSGKTSGVFLKESVWVPGKSYVAARTPQESLEIQLDTIDAQMRLGRAPVPYLEPWFGVGIYANAFGASVLWNEGESSATHYIYFNETDAGKIGEPDFNAQLPRLVMDGIDYFLEQTQGRIPISCTDTQSAFDSASLMWDSTSFFESMFTSPEVVHHVLNRINQAILTFSQQQIDRIGGALAQPGHIMLSARGGPGFSVSDDNIVMISGEHYTEFSAPYNAQLAERFGGLAVHSCGNYERQLDALAATPGIRLIDGAFSKTLDPNPNLQYELFRDRLKGSGIMLQARMHTDWTEILPRLYAPDLRLIAAIPAPEAGTPADSNRRKAQALGIPTVG